MKWKQQSKKQFRKTGIYHRYQTCIALELILFDTIQFLQHYQSTNFTRTKTLFKNNVWTICEINGTYEVGVDWTEHHQYLRCMEWDPKLGLGVPLGLEWKISVLVLFGHKSRLHRLGGSQAKPIHVKWDTFLRLTCSSDPNYRN